MKKPIILCAAALLASCTVTDPHAKKHPHGNFAFKLFDMQDTNGDGVITKRENIEHHRAMFNKVDKNRDGKLTKEEARAKGYSEDFSDHHKKRTQKGYLTFSETYALEAARFDEADLNNDGRVSKAEFKRHYLNSFK